YFANAEKIEQSLINGRKIIDDKFRFGDIEKEHFIDNLKKVILYRIVVPPHTDLNRYFEIMNVRGEQLEQHDILKATLMEPLDERDSDAFAIVWDACRDMTGYVQMHFLKRYRETLFGSGWDWLDLDKYDTLCNQENTNIESRTVLDIINGNELQPHTDGEDETGSRVRFYSIIGFTHFLLHVLKVFASKELDKDGYQIPDLLDDKKLLDTFNSVIESGKQNGAKIGKKDFSLSFIKCLLKCRFLFDKYIIKREYKNEDENGDWSLKELGNNAGKAQYTNTKIKNKWEQSKTYVAHGNERHDNILMLQSCLRVSDTSPKIMHWITVTLKWLYVNYPVDKPANLEFVIENYVQKRIKKDYQKFEEKKFALGVATPHLFFNYLDYLLWKDRTNERYKHLHFADFVFEFRNSVEHWYPQHPSKQSFAKWDDFDGFGNLCIIQRNINSKFSNLSPASKKNTYGQMIEKGSLKLRLMSDCTEDDDEWKNTKCAKHEKEMLNLLRTVCNLPY
ncbi:MAG: HNH endonuclease family protein, partial [Corallococcus sp.]|nr:HNH endonuclease family protein [Corallococcus sp.]